MNNQTAHEGPENRIDQGNFSFEQQVARALGRFEKLDPAARREAVRAADFREGEVMRTRLIQYLDQIEGVKSPEQIETINMITAQYESSVSTWTKLGLSTEGIQTKEEVIAWLNALPASTLKNLATHGEIRLKFIPPGKSIELIESVGGFGFWRKAWGQVGVADWEFGLTVDTEDMPFEESIYYLDPENREAGERKNEEMVDLYEERYTEQGLALMPQEAYIPSMAEALNRDTVLDRKLCTAFKSREGAGGMLPKGSYYNGRTTLRQEYPDISNPSLRCRPWVKGERVSA